MTSNTNLTIDMITREALKVLHEKLSFIKTVNSAYDDSFAKTGAKIGDTLRIRNPVQYKTTDGATMTAQDSVETSQTLTVSNRKHVGMSFSSQELALDIDDFSKRYIEPAVSVLASDIEAAAIDRFTKDIYQVAGTYGAPPTDLVAVGAARAKLNQQATPKDGNRYIQADSVTMGGMVNGLKGLFQDSTQIKEQYREGMIGRTAMADWYENDRTVAITNTADVLGAINNGDLSSGIEALTVDALTAAPAEGMVFTVAGIYDVHPETKAAYSHLKQFVVTSGATTTNLTFSPAMVFSTTDPAQNCSGTPANDDAVTFLGNASTAYQQNLMYHKDAFTFVTADLPLMDNSEKCVRRVQEGLSMRCWTDSDITNDQLLTRIDVLYGFKTIRPQMACRITS